MSLARRNLTSVLKMALRGVPLRATYRGTLKEDYLSKYGSNLQLGCLGSLTNECASFQQTANECALVQQTEECNNEDYLSLSIAERGLGW